MLPFFVKVHIAYIPNGHIVGLSKIPRIVDVFSRRLQVQERLTDEIKDCLQESLNPKGVAVFISAEHHCMSGRGVKKAHVDMNTTFFTGDFKDNQNFQNRFLNSLTNK